MIDDPRQFSQDGLPEFIRNVGQNNHYWGWVVGQCVYWHRMYFVNTGDCEYDFKGSDNSLAKLYHNRIKKRILIDIFKKESTTNLLEKEYLEFVAEITLYFAIKGIDTYQYGEKPKGYKYR